MADHDERWVLNHLIEMCRDEELALAHAADQVKDPGVKKLLVELAADRARFASDLLPHAQRLGGAAAADGTTRGALLRGWTQLKETLMGGANDEQMLKRAEHAEELALSAYEHALDDMLPPTARDLVEQQRNEIRVAHDRVSALLSH